MTPQAGTRVQLIYPVTLCSGRAGWSRALGHRRNRAYPARAGKLGRWWAHRRAVWPDARVASSPARASLVDGAHLMWVAGRAWGTPRLEQSRHAVRRSDEAK